MLVLNEGQLVLALFATRIQKHQGTRCKFDLTGPSGTRRR